MRAGLHDYNDTWYLEETLLHPDVDVTPFDLLHRMNKSWVCPPGTCGEYASTGFEILGLVLAGMAGVRSSRQCIAYTSFYHVPMQISVHQSDIV
eukprot:m.1187531 g.1187531  ORF g.1187531 m.1187531 type:complete len:94 (+) comp24549_c0_seq8:968-1249(+)